MHRGGQKTDSEYLRIAKSVYVTCRVFSNKRLYLQSSAGVIRLYYFFLYAGSAAWYPFFSVYLKDRGLSGTQIGLVFSMVPLMMLLALPAWGVAADHWGRRRVMLLLVATTALLASGFLAMHAFVQLLVWTAVFAIVYNPIAPLLDSLALDHVEQAKDTSFGRLRVWGSIGWAVATPAVGWFIAGKDTRYVFILAAILLTVSFLMGLTARNDIGKRSIVRLSSDELIPVLKNKTLFLFLALIVLIAIGRVAMWNFYSVYLRDIGAGNQLLGIAFSVQAFSELPFFFYAGIVIKRFGLRKVLIFSLLAMAVRIMAYTMIDNPIHAVLIDMSHGLTFSLFIVACIEFVNVLVPENLRATGQTLFWAAHFGAGAILGNTMAGLLYDHMNVKQMYLVCAGTICLGLLVATVAPRLKRP